MSSNWFAKKLGTAPSQGSPPPRQPAQTPYPAQAPQQHQPAPQQTPAPPGDRAPQGATQEEARAAFQQWMATGDTAGGDAHKRGKVGTCPECGSGNYFELRTGHHCYDCGYPVLQGEAIR